MSRICCCSWCLCVVVCATPAGSCICWLLLLHSFSDVKVCFSASFKWRFNVPCNQIVNVSFSDSLWLSISNEHQVVNFSISYVATVSHVWVGISCSELLWNAQPPVFYMMEVKWLCLHSFILAGMLNELETLNQFPAEGNTQFNTPIISIWCLCCVYIFYLYLLFCVA